MSEKKLYFISPSKSSLALYYKLVSEDLDVSSMNRFDTGYNDSYEMRSVKIGKRYFSDNFERDLLPILQGRKLKMVEEAYKQLAATMEREVPTEDSAYLHDSIDSPL